MRAREKQIMFLDRIKDQLIPYGFFAKDGSLWQYQPDNEFVINISISIDRFGGLNEIYISWGSFFSPIQMQTYDSKKLFLGNQFLYLSYAKRIHDSIRSLHTQNDTFKDDLEVILPYFRDDVLYHLPVANILMDDLVWVESFYHLDMMWLPYYFFLLNPEELMLAYLYLGDNAHALHALHADQMKCSATIDMFKQQIETFATDPYRSSSIPYLKENIVKKEAQMHVFQSHQELIEKNQYQSLLDIAMQRRELSEKTCKQMFKHRINIH